ncbi:MAG: pyruvate kinase [Nitrospirae bacterium CG_4_10_14_0_8_um_filter_41_23]|nr:pyruvate kinase [Nitrospirota bacterium]OIP61519.1 MAG: pyruvate kinase [Nitrospirae bacterium CG2_30_41_42]PIQ95133.1 MAG: pyruvate kinase [Nitrospirae bacterium CG11_big_fil_rev_8_21_14_0_20_41_14]PIV43260.1 MAG: pyruvate kinase [Nitrospirae bacterium CG02_land_8_20_14_3_00_41_53]PIW86307.1 MAG: pyruvate kinase [Nitrospirae bacterium CG_4_8_14_3_um_filter_41_47]PIY87339.1 MAG: pyruvate kinase [Nitrospirae bacterium CG_4_10_14_0_8_um_filter_41_23]PJA78771.1 MAG: pyruvate kinase [Nitrospir
MDNRKAKIVCTIGPASARKEVIFSLIKNGMDIARLNFSHGDHDTHKKVIEFIRDISRKYIRPVAILQDLQGIKIRVGLIEGGEVELKKGSKLLLIPGEGIGNQKQIFISYPALLKDAKRGDRILLDDGLIQLSVLGRARNAIRTKVVEGGILRDRKGVNLPGIKTSARSFTEKDKKDLLFGINIGVDYVAISFVRDASDIRKVKEWLKDRKQQIPIIAKIEKSEALCNIEEILSEADGIMVARGDLGVEMPAEEVPLIQKGLIDKANKKGKIVITATQMLESMTEHLRPTRAETTDVANAVIDGTDALMLSAETATGKYPVEAVRMMDRIIRYTESAKGGESSYIRGNTFSEATANAACRAAEDIKSEAIVAFTQSGFTARLLSKFRPKVPIIALTPDERIKNRVCLYWGVTPKIMKLPATTDEMVTGIEKSLLEEHVVKKGDSIVITSSSPLSTMGKTNFMKLHRIGE